MNINKEGSNLSIQAKKWENEMVLFEQLYQLRKY